MRYAAVLVIGVCIGLAAGLAWERLMGVSSPVPPIPHAGDRSSPPLVDQCDDLTNIDWFAEYEFFYARPFASPPDARRS